MKLAFNLKDPEGLACLAFAGIVAGGFVFNRPEQPPQPVFSRVTQISAAETSQARLDLLKKFPLVAEQFESSSLDRGRPESSAALIQKNDENAAAGKVVQRQDAFAVNCRNFQADWAKDLKGQLLGGSDKYPFLHLDGLTTPLHAAEDKNFSYHTEWRATSFTLTRSDKTRDQPSYSLTLACR